MNNDILLNESANFYDELMGIYDIRKDIGYQQAVKDMVDTLGGTCHIRAYRTKIGDLDCMEISWKIPWTVSPRSVYDGSNMILDDSFNAWKRFIEDLTMAYYRLNGGEGFNTYSLIEEIGR